MSKFQSFNPRRLFSSLKYQNKWKIVVNIDASGKHLPPWASGGVQSLIF